MKYKKNLQDIKRNLSQKKTFQRIAAEYWDY